MSNFPRHGLKGNIKRNVFNALLERQRGKCFICWTSQAELEEKASTSEWKHASASVHCTLHIDHCHSTGAIRGLLCEHCNALLGRVENYGVGVEDDYKPSDIDEETYRRMIERAKTWLDQYRTIINLYMQSERWFPRKDILFHIQERAKSCH